MLFFCFAKQFTLFFGERPVYAQPPGLEFWFMLGVHLMTWGAYQSGWFQQPSYVASAISVDWIDLKILTLLSIFFLAFHVNQCFQRQKKSRF
jgi:hypothetical protein